MLFKWIFTILAILWLIRMLNVTFRQVTGTKSPRTREEEPLRPEGEVRIQKRKTRSKDDDYIDYEELHD